MGVFAGNIHRHTRISQALQSDFAFLQRYIGNTGVFY